MGLLSWCCGRFRAEDFPMRKKKQDSQQLSQLGYRFLVFEAILSDMMMMMMGDEDMCMRWWWQLLDALHAATTTTRLEGMYETSTLCFFLHDARPFHHDPIGV